MVIDHIGYAVKKIDKAVKAFENLGYVFEEAIEDVDRNILISFGEKDGYFYHYDASNPPLSPLVRR